MPGSSYANLRWLNGFFRHPDRMIQKKIKQFIAEDRKFSVDVTWNFLSLAVLAASGVIINIIIARFSGPSALGIFNQVFAVYIISSQISVGGLQFSTLKQISYSQEDKERCAQIVTTAFILVLGLSLVVSSLVFTCRELIARIVESPAVGVGISLIAPGLVFYSLNKVLIMCLNGHRHMRAYAIFQALRYLLIVGFIVLIINLNNQAAYLALSLTIAEAILFILLSYYVLKNITIPRLGNNIGEIVSEHFNFGVRGFASGVVIELNTRVDILMLGFFTTDKLVGIYSFAAILAEGFKQFPAVLRWNIDPIIGKHFAEKQLSEITAFAKRIRQLMLPFMLLTGLLAVLLYPYAIQLILGSEEFQTSWGIFAILMLGVIINACFTPFMGVLLQGGRPGTHSIMTIAVLTSNIVLNFLLIPIIGVYGAALATASVFSFEAILLATLAKKVLKVSI